MGAVEGTPGASYPTGMESAKVVLVTNVGMGYGRAVALAYGRSKYHVVCADRDVELASKTAAEIEELGGQAIPIQTDMTTQMDVLGAYHKVMEIFGALGGVVHLASQVSTTPFEDLGEGEFFELMAENVRSTYLALKVAARLLPGGWVVVVAPPTLGSVQMSAVQGAIKEMVLGFRDRFAHPRVNLVLPSRAPSDPRHDQTLVRAVRFLGSPEATGLSGQVFDVELPQPPRLTENLLPEVRAALDSSVRQSEHDHWSAWLDEDEAEDAAAMLAAPGVRWPNRANHEHAAADLAESYGEEQEAAQDAEYDLEYESDDWADDLGLPEGPALRHLVAEEGDAPSESHSYASGVEPAIDLYGDLRRLVGPAQDDDAPVQGDDNATWPFSPRRIH